MNNIKSYWNGLSQSQRLGIIRENHFGDDLSVFNYNMLPEDLIKILIRRIKDKPPLNSKIKHN